MTKVLVACEESQVVTIALRKLGIEAFSCDLEPCSGWHSEWHIQKDVRLILNRDWDAVLAFPPCTDLAVSGARHFSEKKKNGDQQRSIDFFMLFTNLSCPFVSIENPIGIMSKLYRPPDQIFEPWQFGHSETKKTCLWLKNLPCLKSTKPVAKGICKVHMMSPSKNRAKLRSKTYLGVAEAMAGQWGPIIKRGDI